MNPGVGASADVLNAPCSRTSWSRWLLVLLASVISTLLVLAVDGAAGSASHRAKAAQAGSVSGVILRFSYEDRPQPLDLVAPDSISLISDESYRGLQWSSFGGSKAMASGYLTHT